MLSHLMRKKKFDVVALQLEAVHEYVMGGFIRVFEEMGLRTLVILNERIMNLRGNFFDYMGGYSNSKIQFVPVNRAADWIKIRRIVSHASPSLAFFNTLHSPGPARLAVDLELPVLGVVHNCRSFRASHDCMKLIESDTLRLVGLAPHAVDAIKAAVPRAADHVYLHYPYDWTPDDYVPKQTYGPVRKIGIPGAVSYRNRDFEGLIAYLAQADLSRTEPFEIHILSGGPDLEKLKKTVREQGLERYFFFVEKDPNLAETSTETYFAGLADCDVCLALLPDRSQEYLTYKITAGVMTAIGMGIPMIAQRRIGAAYGFPAIEPPDDSGFAFLGVDLSPERLAGMRNQMMKVKAEGLRNNREILEPVIREMMAVRAK